jgi:hypothetical protein
MNKIRAMRWEAGPVLNLRHETISTRENDYFSEYNNILTEYFTSVGLDLTSDIEVRPFLFLVKAQTHR